MKIKSIAILILFLPSLFAFLYHNQERPIMLHKATDGTPLLFDRTYELFYSQENQQIVYLNGHIYKHSEPGGIKKCITSKPSKCQPSLDTPKAVQQFFNQNNQ